MLDVETVLDGTKQVSDVSGENLENGCGFVGYEIHMGKTAGPDTDRPLLRFSGRPVGRRQID